MYWTSVLLQPLLKTFRRCVVRFRAWMPVAELQDLYDHAPCALFALDADGRFLRLNARALLWFGCTQEEMLGQKGPEDFFMPACRTQFAECFAVLQAHGQVEGLEFDLVSRQGVRRRVSLSATAVCDRHGRLQQVRCVLHDITELMRAKNRLQTLAAEQRAILDNDLVGIIKLQGSRTVWKNRTVETMFGYAPGELRSQTARVLYRSDAEYLQTSQAAATALAHGERFRTELQLVRKDGTTLWIDLSAVRVASDTNETVWSFVDVTPMVRRHEHANRLAFRDPLTGLPNRHQFEAVVPEVIARAQASGTPAAICFLDLDGFKPVNDTHGHAAGDLLLREVARRITQRLRMDDAVYRFGGDEFVLLLPNVMNAESCTAVVNRVLEGIAEPVRLGSGQYVRVTASVGVALFPGDGHALEELIHLADQAMYLAKRRELHSSPVSYAGESVLPAVASKLAPTVLATVGSKLPPTATAA